MLLDDACTAADAPAARRRAADTRQAPTRLVVERSAAAQLGVRRERARGARVLGAVRALACAFGRASAAVQAAAGVPLRGTRRGACAGGRESAQRRVQDRRKLHLEGTRRGA